MKLISLHDESSSQSNETETERKRKRKTRKLHYKASWWTQFSTLLEREFLAWKRMPKMTTIRIYLTIVRIINQLTKIDLIDYCFNCFIKLHSLLFGFAFWRQNYDQIGAMNIHGAIYIMMNNVTNTLSFFVITVS